MGFNLYCGNYSYVESLKKYEFIFGLTGTLESLHDISIKAIK